MHIYLWTIPRIKFIFSDGFEIRFLVAEPKEIPLGNLRPPEAGKLRYEGLNDAA
jgi:hypothetical protein